MYRGNEMYGENDIYIDKCNDFLQLIPQLWLTKTLVKGDVTKRTKDI